MKLQHIILITLLLMTACQKKEKGVFSLSEIQNHNSKDSCWIAIDGNVYDVTSYLEKHPAPVNKLPTFCGKEASKAFNTKAGKGRPHSEDALKLLPKYKIGILEKS